MDIVSDVPGKPSLSSLLTQWTVQPVALAVIVVLCAGYAYGLRRVGRALPRWRIVVFGCGIALLAWASCGFWQVYASSLYWVWTAQALLIWLVVPITVLSGHPIQLARAVNGPGGRVDRILASRFCRVVGNPLVGPALVPVLSAVLFFGPLPGATIRYAGLGWLFSLALLAVGAAMVLPLAGLDETASSLAVGLSLAIGSFELVLDALPGVILRLNTGLVTNWFTYRGQTSWTPDALHDQGIAGAILWCMAEIIDLPFLILVYRRWLRADSRDAAQEDAVLEAERAARGAINADEGADVPPDRDAPWWISDPVMQRRLRGRG